MICKKSRFSQPLLGRQGQRLSRIRLKNPLSPSHLSQVAPLLQATLRPSLSQSRKAERSLQVTLPSLALLSLRVVGSLVGNRQSPESLSLKAAEQQRAMRRRSQSLSRRVVELPRAELQPSRSSTSSHKAEHSQVASIPRPRPHSAKAEALPMGRHLLPESLSPRAELQRRAMRHPTSTSTLFRRVGQLLQAMRRLLVSQSLRVERLRVATLRLRLSLSPRAERLLQATHRPLALPLLKAERWLVATLLRTPTSTSSRKAGQQHQATRHLPGSQQHRAAPSLADSTPRLRLLWVKEGLRQMDRLQQLARASLKAEPLPVAMLRASRPLIRTLRSQVGRLPVASVLQRVFSPRSRAESPQATLLRFVSRLYKVEPLLEELARLPEFLSRSAEGLRVGTRRQSPGSNSPSTLEGHSLEVQVRLHLWRSDLAALLPGDSRQTRTSARTSETSRRATSTSRPRVPSGELIKGASALHGPGQVTRREPLVDLSGVQ